MPRVERLTKAKDFAAVRREGRSFSDNLLVLILRPNQMDVTRVGFLVSRRVGEAVARNKVKRRLREAARLAQVEQGWDLVIIARKSTTSADFHQLSYAMANLLRRARVLDTPPQHLGPPSKAG